MTHEIRFVTPGGIPGRYNVYFDDWTCKINAIFNIDGIDITTFDVVNSTYLAEHPPTDDEI